MATPVALFNTNALPIQVSVNGGRGFNIPGATAPSWAPQCSPNEGPSWSYSPGPNALAPGNNFLEITVGGSAPQRLVMHLSESERWSSVQVYILFRPGIAGWVVLNGGQYMSASLPSGPQ
jgi:hypothetical protein